MDEITAFLDEHPADDTPECVVVPVTDGLPGYLVGVDDSVGRSST